MWSRDMFQPLAEEWKPNVWMWLLMVVIAAVIIVWAVLFDPRLVLQVSLPAIPGIMNAQIQSLYSVDCSPSDEWCYKTTTLKSVLRSRRL